MLAAFAVLHESVASEKPTTRQIVNITVVNTPARIAKTSSAPEQLRSSHLKVVRHCLNLLLEDTVCVIARSPHFTYKYFL